MDAYEYGLEVSAMKTTSEFVRINISAGSEKELDQRVKDLEERGWQLKQVVPPEEKHFQDYTVGTRGNRKVHRTNPGFVKYRAVMVKVSSVEGETQ